MAESISFVEDWHLRYVELIVITLTFAVCRLILSRRYDETLEHLLRPME